MIPGLGGSLLSHDALAPWLETAARRADDAPARAAFGASLSSAWSEMGPVHGPRAVFDRIATPLAGALGLRLTLDGVEHQDVLHARIEADDRAWAVLVVTAWGRDPREVWRESVLRAIAWNVRWSVCLNGPSVRIIDSRRTYSRRFAEIDLREATASPLLFTLLRGLLDAHAFADPRGPALDRMVAASEQFRAAVRASLQQGVHESLTLLMTAFARARRPAPHGAQLGEVLLDESLTVIYRILFLLFAEARGLVPRWHPTYRDSYTIESLREIVERRPRPRGLWESLQAIARLAHTGCSAGELRVPPFNGRLFSPTLAPLAATRQLDDGAVREALLSLTTRPGRSGRERISYADLGVEQLGGVYERILDYTPAPGRPAALVKGNRRKSTGAFYTPRSLTEYLVRRTLAPLVQAATPDGILALRVLDPAMGSGAFLVAACRYLSSAYEAALVREGNIAGGDLSDDDRAGFRRAVAQRCLYGVDLNPTAVQLGRLSLWLATLARDRPLTFLDHHLRSGNSLVGAPLADIALRPPGRSRRRLTDLPLFAVDTDEDAIASIVGPRLALASGPGDTLQQVRDKERLLASLGNQAALVSRWKAVADLWCAGWYPLGRESAAVFTALADELLGRAVALPRHLSSRLLASARDTAGREAFFHWTLEFPEAFYAPDGGALDPPGFDAVIGNPPWEMLRGDAGSGDDRRAAAAASSTLTAFARESGAYTLQREGHANLFQLFAERSLSLVRRGGRLGLLLPSGFATDHGCGPLRRHMLERTHIDTCVSLENRDGLFPIHRSVRFLLVCATAGGSTPALPYRAGLRAVEALDRMPDSGSDPDAIPLRRALLERISGPHLAIPEIRSAADLALVSRLAFTHPALGDPDGWGVRFGRELNASDDRPQFVERSPVSRDQCPILEGKHVQPFSVNVSAARSAIPQAVAARLLDRARTFGRARLAYRDVSSATNRLTLIAAVIPPGAVTTHTLFCLKGDLPPDVHHFLCGVFNSFVANYLVRLRVTTHVTAGIIDRLPVPRPSEDSAAFREIVRLARTLSAAPGETGAAARLQGAVARLYACTPAELGHVLETFPLIDDGFKQSCLDLL